MLLIILKSIIQEWSIFISDVYEVVKILLENGADVTRSGNILRISRNSLDQWLIEHLDLSEVGYGALDDVFPLFVSVNYRLNEETLKMLLSAGADVSQQTAVGQTALHALCKSYDEGREIEKFSLDDVDPSDETTAKIRLLIDHGADVNICDNFGKSPLHYAAHHQNRQFSRILLQNGANVFQEDKNGLTALDYAADRDYLFTMALIDKYSFPVEQIIQAYECVAVRAPSPSELLKTATLLRREHGIERRVLPPVECYGFKKEWETIEELEEFAEDEFQVLLACVLARERISQEKGFDIARPTIDECKCIYIFFIIVQINAYFKFEIIYRQVLFPDLQM